MKNKSKRMIAALCCGAVIATGGLSASARNMNMYVNGIKLVRNVEQVWGIDMLPVLDIANEMGFNAYVSGNNATLSNSTITYYFSINSPTVTNSCGGWYGLDVSPHYIGGRFMIPATFFRDVFGYSYVWDEITDTVFLNSPNEYEWIVNNRPASAYKKAEFMERYNRIDAKRNSTGNTYMTQYEINKKTYELYQEFDALLNDIYLYLKETMPAWQFEQLRQDEIRWINEKEAAAEAEAAPWGTGSGAPMVRYSVLYTYTADRCLYLMALIK